MAAKILTVEDAKAANIDVVVNGRYTQAVHETVVALRAARRSGTANTKTKAEVSYSGAKPWKQKGTGRARAGYKSSPVWRGGGVVFGPKPRDYSKRISKTVKRAALRKALSERIKGGDIFVVDTFVVAQPKTKEFLTALKQITPEEKVMVVSTAFDETTLLAARNVSPVLLMRAADVNAEHLLLFKKIVLTGEALAALSERIAK